MTDDTQHTPRADLLPAAAVVAGDRSLFLSLAAEVRAHLAALDGLSQVDQLEAIVRRTLAPTASRLRRELAGITQ
jgi:hypothetical protein